jgi:hypothetical protein
MGYHAVLELSTLVTLTEAQKEHVAAATLDSEISDSHWVTVPVLEWKLDNELSPLNQWANAARENIVPIEINCGGKQDRQCFRRINHRKCQRMDQ